MKTRGGLACIALLLLMAGCALGIGSAVASGATSPLPQPELANDLAAVSCVSAGSCWAVGGAQDTDNTQADQILHWTGGDWSTVTAPGGQGELEGISCTATSSCMSVGYVSGVSSVSRPASAQWNGMAWTAVTMPTISRAYVQAVSCTSHTACWAVGATGKNSKPLALRWNGRRWQMVPTPSPTSKYTSELQSVSCVSAGDCWAFGMYYATPTKPTLAAYIFALHWNGSRWTIAWHSQAYPGADSSFSLRTDVACASATDCWADGAASDSPLYDRSYLIRWNGRTWTEVATPKLGNASLTGMACTSVRQCWAVGNRGTFYGGTHTLILRWDGSTWAQAAAPSSKGTLAGVSCGSAHSCLAVGDQNRTQSTLNLAAVWNGSSWSGS